MYNAAIASNITVKQIASYADTVQMCFSKGLGAPIGSIIVGPKDFIERARHVRKAMGGGWRQSGVIAAAAHVSLDHAEATIRADHERAKKLAKMINEATPDALRKKVYAKEEDITNMVLLHCENGVTVQQMNDHLQKHDILAMTFDAKRIRMVLNWNVCDENLDTIVTVYKKFVESL
uniref:Beta_elim_lyase domain-containing protein n=1 Tax=Caenorhabditis japonica TaxID=281687 RepID=A0A8R1EI32_CAEJA